MHPTIYDNQRKLLFVLKEKLFDYAHLAVYVLSYNTQIYLIMGFN